MPSLLIKNALIVNENETFKGCLLIEENYIAEIFKGEAPEAALKGIEVLDAEGKLLIPGVIDDQVHFRDWDMSYKAEFRTESKAAAAGGVTSIMDMPNTSPKTTTQELLAKRFELAARNSSVNYSIYMGTTNDNLEEVLKTDPRTVCGVKIFMGASTGNMLVDSEDTLSTIFKNSKSLIAVHCEEEAVIKRNVEQAKAQYGEDVPIEMHPVIRSVEACYESSYKAIKLAKAYNTRLHVLHISTAKELELFDNQLASKDKQITAEVCVHHLWFDDRDYAKLGSKIKWNPSVKAESDKIALFNGLLSNKIDVIATDHAPHTSEEKRNSYFTAPSGGPLVQHSLVSMLDFYHQGKISLEKVIEKMCHAPADIFKIEKRGYLRKGYFADIVLVDLKKKWIVAPENILYKCGWSPMEGHQYQSTVTHTFVNGNLVYKDGEFAEAVRGKRLEFDRK